MSNPRQRLDTLAAGARVRLGKDYPVMVVAEQRGSHVLLGLAGKPPHLLYHNPARRVEVVSQPPGSGAGDRQRAAVDAFHRALVGLDIAQDALADAEDCIPDSVMEDLLQRMAGARPYMIGSLRNRAVPGEPVQSVHISIVEPGRLGPVTTGIHSMRVR